MRFEEWMSTIGINAFRHANCCKIAYEAGQQSRQAEIDDQQKRIEELETGSLLQSNHIAELTANLKQAVAELNSRETRINLLIQKWEKDAEYADQIASEDCVQNTLNDCIEELRQVIKGGDE